MASFRSSVILAVFCLYAVAASAAIQNEKRLLQVEEQKSNCRKTDLSYETSTDDIDKFDINYQVAKILHMTHEDEKTLCSLKISWKTAGRIHSLAKVYDGLAEVSPDNPYFDPGYTVVVKHFDSYEQAKEKAIDALVDHLAKLGLINEKPCHIDSYPHYLVDTHGQCLPNSTVSACTECTFHCTNEADVDFDKTTTVRCCGNGHFDQEIMPCDATATTTTNTTPASTTKALTTTVTTTTKTTTTTIATTTNAPSPTTTFSTTNIDTSTMSPSGIVVTSSTFTPTKSSQRALTGTMVTTKCDPSTDDCHVTLPTNSTSHGISKGKTEDRRNMLFLLIPVSLFALSFVVVMKRCIRSQHRKNPANALDDDEEDVWQRPRRLLAVV